VLSAGVADIGMRAPAGRGGRTPGPAGGYRARARALTASAPFPVPSKALTQCNVQSRPALAHMHARSCQTDGTWADQWPVRVQTWRCGRSRLVDAAAGWTLLVSRQAGSSASPAVLQLLPRRGDSELTTLLVRVASAQGKVVKIQGASVLMKVE